MAVPRTLQGWILCCLVLAGHMVGFPTVGLCAEIFVDRSATSGSGDGHDWANASLFLQDALAAASSGDTLHVAAGVHYPDEGAGQTADDPHSSFTIASGVTLLGGYPGGGGARNPALNLTVLSGDLQKNDLNLDGNFIAEDFSQIAGRNAYSVVLLQSNPSTAMLSGLTITAGQSNEPDYTLIHEASGGGITASFASLDLEHCRLIGNGAIVDGGGLYLYGRAHQLKIDHCQFLSNSVRADSTSSRGAAFTFRGDELRVSHCLFEGNVLSSEDFVSPSGFVIGANASDNNSSCIINDTEILNNRLLASSISSSEAIWIRGMTSASLPVSGRRDRLRPTIARQVLCATDRRARAHPMALVHFEIPSFASQSSSKPGQDFDPSWRPSPTPCGPSR